MSFSKIVNLLVLSSFVVVELNAFDIIPSGPHHPTTEIPVPFSTGTVREFDLSALHVPSSGTLLLNKSHPALGFGIGSDELPLTRELDVQVGLKKTIERWENVFGGIFERKFDALPKSGTVSKLPWPGSYFPTVNDGINDVNGRMEPSPTEKYASAFNLSPKRLKDQVSAWSGIDAHTDRLKCSVDYQCAFYRDGSVCASRSLFKPGRCIPEWWGLCHAWAPASILEPEPVCSVYKNRVKFNVYDIKALLTQLYDQSSVNTVFAGKRCNFGKPETDVHDRYVDPRCRDMTPAMFHLLISNVVGRLRHAFVVDVDANAPVWNQPVYGYDTYKTSKVTVQEANRYVAHYRDMSEEEKSVWSFNPNAKALVYVETRFTYVYEDFSPYSGPLTSSFSNYRRFLESKYYKYILELDENDEIIGGEWIGNSKHNHPDFAWMPISRPTNDSQVAGISYVNVQELLRRSVACETDDTNPPLPCNYKNKLKQWLCEKGLLAPRPPPNNSTDPDTPGCIGRFCGLA